MSGIPTLTILSEEQKFNGDNLLQWNMYITQLLASKGLSGYIDGKTQKPGPESIPLPDTPSTTPQPTGTPIYSSTPSLDEWTFRDQLARGHITLNCTDAASLGVVTTGTAKEAWDSIQNEWGKSTDMRRSHAQEALNRTVYAEGTDIQDHIKSLRTRKAALDSLSNPAMNDEAWRGVIIRSIPPTSKWLPVIPSLYTMSSSADIISTLLAHGMILGREVKPAVSIGSSNTALVTRATEGCTNPKCKAKKRSTHTTLDCYWPGGGKEGQFPPNFGQRSKANAATSTPSSGQTTSTPQAASTPASQHFVLSAQIPGGPGQSGILIGALTESGYPPMALISKGFRAIGKGEIPSFLDSAASDTMFVSREDFSEYKSTSSRTGDSAKAIDGGFEIIGEGSVFQRYKVDGKERDITYTRALHAPTLNANLVSVSALDRAGLLITFGNGQGVV